MASFIRRTETLTRAPILSGLRRILPRAGGGDPGAGQAEPLQGACFSQFTVLFAASAAQ
jgi:hypothetical protein